MTNEQIKALGVIVQALITSMGMQAENMQREQQGYSMAYGDDAFYEQVQVIEKALEGLEAQPQ